MPAAGSAETSPTNKSCGWKRKETSKVAHGPHGPCSRASNFLSQTKAARAARATHIYWMIEHREPRGRTVQVARTGGLPAGEGAMAATMCGKQIQRGGAWQRSEDLCAQRTRDRREVVRGSPENRTRQSTVA